MTLKPTLHERAFLLTAEFATVAGIRQQLMREGYESVDAQLAAPSLRRDLKRLCRASAVAESAQQDAE